LDPNFGLAWSLLAYTVTYETDNAFLSPRDGYERVRQLAQQALKLSPELSPPHAVLSYAHRTYEWDWAAAEVEGRRALDLDPGNTQALSFAGMLSNTLGRWEDAARKLRSALVRDPLNTDVIFNLGVGFYSAGRFADAEASFRKLIALEPGYWWGHMYLGKTLLAEGQPQAALAMVQGEFADENRLVYMPIVLQAAGRKAEADEALASLIKKYADRDAYYVAMTYAYRGDRDLALQWLERAYNQKDVSLVEIVGEPLFNNLMGDPRFEAFLRKMNLPE
jgi:serine/threonine-protein kinase